jgi:hypothetical protein
MVQAQAVAEDKGVQVRLESQVRDGRVSLCFAPDCAGKGSGTEPRSSGRVVNLTVPSLEGQDRQACLLSRPY